MMILFGVIATLIGFIIGARLMRKGKGLYDTAITVDQIGIVIEVTDAQALTLKDVFTKHKVLEVHEEAIT